MAAKDESYFISQLSNFEYHTKTVSDLLAQLTNLDAIFKHWTKPKFDNDRFIKLEDVDYINKKIGLCEICGKSNCEDEKCHYQNESCFTCSQKELLSPTCYEKKDGEQYRNNRYKKKSFPFLLKKNVIQEKFAEDLSTDSNLLTSQYECEFPLNEVSVKIIKYSKP